MLEISDLCTGYGSHWVISHMNLKLPSGKFTAIIGPNGCGKSTLLKAIAGILPVKGSIRFLEEELSSMAPRERARRISFLPQNRSIPELTAEKLILHGRFPYLSYPRHYKDSDWSAARDAISQLGIQDLSHRSLPTLSGGERQKVYLAMLLAQQTPVLLMDEPTSFLDISHKFEIVSIGRSLAQQGKTVVMVLHDLDLALTYADHIVLMQDGAIAGQGSPEQICQDKILEQVFQICIERVNTNHGHHYCFLPRK